MKKPFSTNESKCRNNAKNKSMNVSPLVNPCTMSIGKSMEQIEILFGFQFERKQKKKKKKKPIHMISVGLFIKLCIQ